MTPIYSDRVPLVGLAPLGIGTPWAESLESYVMRLAVAHSVVPRAVVAFALQPHGRASETKPDQPGVSRMQLATTLAELTAQPAVAGLGLARFAGRVSANHSLKTRHAWCRACLGEMEVPWLPLLWSTQGYLHCDRHDLPLTEACACGAQFAVGSGYLHRFTCNRCGLQLAKSAKGRQASPNSFDRAISRTLEGFCADLARLNLGPLPPPDLKRAAKLVVQRHDQPISVLCKSIGLRRSDDLLGEGDPLVINLGVLARLATLAGVPVAALFDASLWVEAPEAPSPGEGEALTFVHSCGRRDYRAIKETVVRWMAEGRRLSMVAMAERLETTPTNLRFILGAHLSSRVVENAKAARLAEKEARALARCQV